MGVQGNLGSVAFDIDCVYFIFISKIVHMQDGCDT